KSSSVRNSVIRRRARRPYNGIVDLKILRTEEREESMGKVMAATIVIALAGSTLLLNANASTESRAASTLLAVRQDPQELQLRRLEQLAARVAKLEGEISRLEETNKQLKAQLVSNAPAAAPG